MKASMVPFDAASKHSNGCMIWPPAKTSIRKRPPLVSSTIFASCSALACTSSPRVHAVDMRHWIFGWAMTLGASTILVVAAAASAPPVLTRNLRRSVTTCCSLSSHVLLIRTLGDVVPRAHEALELRERGVHLSSHRAPLRLCPHLLDRQLPQVAQERLREEQHLDTSLEIGPEPLERDRILRVVVTMTVHVDRRRRVVEHSLKLDRKRLVGLLVEAERGRRPRLVPTGIVVVPSGLVEH